MNSTTSILVGSQWFLNLLPNQALWGSPGLVCQKIQEPLAQGANLLGVVGVKAMLKNCCAQIMRTCISVHFSTEFVIALLCDVGIGLQVRTTIGNILEADHGKTFVTSLEVVFTSARVRSRQKESAWRLY